MYFFQKWFMVILYICEFLLLSSYASELQKVPIYYPSVMNYNNNSLPLKWTRFTSSQNKKRNVFTDVH